MTGTDVNWRQVIASAAGHGTDLSDVSAVVLTHAHPDHIGGAERLRAAGGIPVWVAATEAPHARGEVIEEVSMLQILRAAWRPQVLRWAVRIARAGVTRVERLTEVTPVEAPSASLDVPGRLVPIPTPATPADTAPSTYPTVACSSPVIP